MLSLLQRDPLAGRDGDDGAILSIELAGASRQPNGRLWLEIIVARSLRRHIAGS
jgi:hypothetical protein